MQVNMYVCWEFICRLSSDLSLNKHVSNVTYPHEYGTLYYYYLLCNGFLPRMDEMTTTKSKMFHGSRK